MITPQFLKSCTDEQINRGVAWLDVMSGYNNDGFGLVCREGEIWDKSFFMPFMPSTSPNDAWPIMMANLISITPRNRFSCAQPYASSGVLPIMVHCDSNEGLLRAAMEVYILMSTQS